MFLSQHLQGEPGKSSSYLPVLPLPVKTPWGLASQKNVLGQNANSRKRELEGTKMLQNVPASDWWTVGAIPFKEPFYPIERSISIFCHWAFKQPNTLKNRDG